MPENIFKKLLNLPYRYLLFWLSCTLVWLALFAPRTSNFSIIFTVWAYYFGVAVLMVFINHRYLFPRLFQTQQYFTYLGVMVLFFGFTIVSKVNFEHLIWWVFAKTLGISITKIYYPKDPAKLLGNEITQLLWMVGIAFYFKMSKHFINQTTQSPISEEQSGDFTFFKSDKKMVKVFWQDILYIEGLKDYVVIHTTQGKVITKQTMKYMEQTLPSLIFIRIHRSHIINRQHIQSIVGNAVEINKKLLTVAQSYREQFFTEMKGKLFNQG